MSQNLIVVSHDPDTKILLTTIKQDITLSWPSKEPNY